MLQWESPFVTSGLTEAESRSKSDQKRTVKLVDTEAAFLFLNLYINNNDTVLTKKYMINGIILIFILLI